MKENNYMHRSAKIILVNQFFAISDNQMAKDKLMKILGESNDIHPDLPVDDVKGMNEFEAHIGINFVFDEVKSDSENTHHDLFKGHNRFMDLFRHDMVRLAGTFGLTRSDMSAIKIPNRKSNDNHVYKYGMKLVDMIRKKVMQGADLKLFTPVKSGEGESYTINNTVYNTDIPDEAEDAMFYDESVRALFCCVCISIMAPIPEKHHFTAQF